VSRRQQRLFLFVLLPKLPHRPVSIFLLLFDLLGASPQWNILRTFFLCVPYQRSTLVSASFNQLLSDERMPLLGRY
jgi:hypothetical protein